MLLLIELETITFQWRWLLALLFFLDLTGRVGYVLVGDRLHGTPFYYERLGSGVGLTTSCLLLILESGLLLTAAIIEVVLHLEII